MTGSSEADPRIVVARAARLYARALSAPTPKDAAELRALASEVQIHLIRILGKNPAVPAGELIDRAIIELKKKRTCKP
jgi:hypothetical protein